MGRVMGPGLRRGNGFESQDEHARNCPDFCPLTQNARNLLFYHDNPNVTGDVMAIIRPMRVDVLRASRANSGAALHNIRAEKGLTLTEMSARTGVPASTLSKIENGKMPLSYDKLARISTGLDIDVAALLSPPGAGGAPASIRTARRSISRAGEGQSVETDKCSQLYPAADLLNKRFVPLVAELRARSIEEFGELIRHPGEAYAYVLEGAVELYTEIYAPVVLNTGDSIYFDGDMAHAYLAVAPGPCRVLTICTGA